VKSGFSMGNVRIKLVKRTAREMLVRYANLFTDDFEHNKEVLMQVAEIPSKTLRNQIAGYVTKLVRRQRKIEQQLSLRQELTVTDEEEYIKRIEGV